MEEQNFAGAHTINNSNHNNNNNGSGAYDNPNVALLSSYQQSQQNPLAYQLSTYSNTYAQEILVAQSQDRAVGAQQPLLPPQQQPYQHHQPSQLMPPFGSFADSGAPQPPPDTGFLSMPPSFPSFVGGGGSANTAPTFYYHFVPSADPSQQQQQVALPFSSQNGAPHLQISFSQQQQQQQPNLLQLQQAGPNFGGPQQQQQQPPPPPANQISLPPPAGLGSGSNYLDQLRRSESSSSSNSASAPALQQTSGIRHQKLTEQLRLIERTRTASLDADAERNRDAGEISSAFASSGSLIAKPNGADNSQFPQYLGGPSSSSSSSQAALLQYVLMNPPAGRGPTDGPAPKSLAALAAGSPLVQYPPLQQQGAGAASALGLNPTMAESQPSMGPTTATTTSSKKRAREEGQPIAVRKRKKSTACSSRFRGVTWHKRDRRWIARAWVERKMMNLGSFATEQEAALVVERKYLETYGANAAAISDEELLEIAKKNASDKAQSEEAKAAKDKKKKKKRTADRPASPEPASPKPASPKPASFKPASSRPSSPKPASPKPAHPAAQKPQPAQAAGETKTPRSEPIA